jgi:transmembrane sensor
VKHSQPSDLPPPRVAPLDWARPAGAEDIVEREMRACVRQRQRRRRRFAFTSAGAAALLLVAGVLVWHAAPTAPGAASSSAPAFASGPATRTLPDGTVVEFNGAVGFAVEFTPELRRVVLRDGEAHFQVVKNPARPFVVVARGVEVRAVGTAFSVQVATFGVDVLVTEGRVAVASTIPSPTGVTPQLLDAGQGISLSNAAGEPAPIQPIEPAAIAARLAWRVPNLELNFTPLSAVLPVVNAHSGSKLILADADLGDLKLSGRLRASNLPVLLKILESSYGVTAERHPGGEIVLCRRR